MRGDESPPTVRPMRDDSKLLATLTAAIVAGVLIVIFVPAIYTMMMNLSG